MKRASANRPLALVAALLISCPAWSGPVGPGLDASARRASPSTPQTGNSARSALAHIAIEAPKVLGRTYGEWAAEWVAWSEAGPVGQNAITDPTGQFCAANQPARNVWFLAGTFGGHADRSCTIPRNRWLFYPIVEVPWIDCPGTADETLSDADVRDILANSFSGPTEIGSTLNGVPVVSLQVPIVRVQSPRFTNVLPDNSVLTGACPTPLPGGRTGRRIADGYWVMLPPLPPGRHEVTLRGALPGFETSVTYSITVP
jgi:hypothetical protein